MLECPTSLSWPRRAESGAGCSASPPWARGRRATATATSTTQAISWARGGRASALRARGTLRRSTGGPNFYAPQTLEAPDGRRILMGWMSPNFGALPTQADGWCGQLTVPRELSLAADGTLRLLARARARGALGSGARARPGRARRQRGARRREGPRGRPRGPHDRPGRLARRARRPQAARHGGRRLQPTWPTTTSPDAWCSTARRRARASAATGRRPSPRARSRPGAQAARPSRPGVRRGLCGDGELVLSAYSLPGAGPRAVSLVAENGALRASRLAVRRPRA